MNGKRRYGVPESNPDATDSLFWSKKTMVGSTFDSHRAEPSRLPLMPAPQLDLKQAEKSRKHVRALNTQFASWVQSQLENHPDELWEDGVRKYLLHSSNIMEKFKDVVNWLKTNSAKGQIFSAMGCNAVEKEVVPDSTNRKTELFSVRNGFDPVDPPETDPSFKNSGLVPQNQSSGIFSNRQNPGIFSKSQTSGLFSDSQSSGLRASSQTSGLFSNSQTSGLFSNSQTSGISSNSQTSGLFSNSQTSGISSNNQTSGIFSNNQTSGIFSHNQTSGIFSNNQTSGIFSNNQTSGILSNNQTSGIFSNNQTSGIFSSNQSSGTFSNNLSSGLFSNNLGSQQLVSGNSKDPEDADDENDVQQPSSPSLKKSEEKGIVVVHEVKCKLYVKGTDPADKDVWKDRGTGQLSIKCNEGVSKGTKESKPTVVVRNDVGKVLLNALLYPGIKTSSQKNSIVAIFHTLADGGGTDGSKSEVIARTFLIRTKTEDDRNKLAEAIQNYAPEA